MKKDPASTWAKFIATLLILTIVGLAIVSVFQLGPTGEWKIKVDGIEASGSSVLLGFAVVLLIIFWRIWPDFARAIFEIRRALGGLATGFFRLFKR